MALKSTVFKAQLQVADIDHGHYADHALTLARHPSETDERMMVRLAALALQAHTLQSVCNGDGHLAFVRSPDGISIEILQKGERLAPAEPWASMGNTGAW